MAIPEFFKKIKRLKKDIDKLQPDAVHWDMAYLEKLKIDFTYTSNHLEGNRVSLGQTVQILKEFVSPQNTSVADVLDIVNHKAVLDIVFEDYNSQQLSESNIQKLHKELMKNPLQWGDEIHVAPGRYKILENFTYREKGKLHTYALPADVPMEMSLLLQQTNSELANYDVDTVDLHPLSIATRFHYVFLNKIHPFGDGNGRIARIFMNLILLKTGFPPIFISEVEKSKYMGTFSKEEKQPGAMLEFMAERLIESLKDKKKFLSMQKKNEKQA